VLPGVLRYTWKDASYRLLSVQVSRTCELDSAVAARVPAATGTVSTVAMLLGAESPMLLRALTR
jgi:hypothetical protein